MTTSIGLFISACRSLGVEESELFETVDLYEERDLPRVWRCVLALERVTKERSRQAGKVEEVD